MYKPYLSKIKQERLGKYHFACIGQIIQVYIFELNEKNDLFCDILLFRAALVATHAAEQPCLCYIIIKGHDY